MKTNGFKGKRVRGTALAAAMLIAVSAAAFQGLTRTAAAAEYNKTSTVPTTYAGDVGRSSPAVKSSVPEGYKKASYNVKSNGLAYYKSHTPTGKDMTKEAAAEFAAQYLWQVYGASMQGRTIEMGYEPATDSMPRPEWSAEVRTGDLGFRGGYRVDGYYAAVDAVTGELFDIGMTRTLEAKVKAGPDASLDESKYETAAKKLAEKFNVVHGAVASVNCSGQGASFPTNTIGEYGDPDISFEIHGANGEVALMTISRYDKVLLGIGYNAEYQGALAKAKQVEQQARASAQKSKTASSGAAGKAPSLTMTTEG